MTGATLDRIARAHALQRLIPAAVNDNQAWRVGA
jgi:hypothetical protein